MKWLPVVSFLLTLSLCLLSLQGKSQEKAGRKKYFYSVVPVKRLPPSVSKLIPKGYLPLDTAIGDLNQDGIADLLLVVRKKGEEVSSDAANNKEAKRPLFILLGNVDGTYTMAKRNDNVVWCIDCGNPGDNEDPFTGLKIKNGYFSIEHAQAGGTQHWNTVTTFKYNKEKNDWYLSKDGVISYKMNPDTDPDAEVLIKDYERIKTNKDFGIIPFEKYDVKK